MSSIAPLKLPSLKQKLPLYQIAQDAIKTYIIDNSLKPGDPLPTEQELANQLNISRTSVREAVRSLAALGVIESQVGAGLFVSNFSFDPLLANMAYGLMFDLKELNDIIEVRFHLEEAMADRALQAVTEDQITRIRTILTHMQAEANEGRYSAEDDRAFHQALWHNVDNAILGKIIDTFWIVLYRARENSSVPDVDDPVETYQLHVAIAEALEKRDLEALHIAMKQHWGYPDLRLGVRPKQLP